MGVADPAALERAAQAVEKEAKTLRDAARPYGQGAKDMIWQGQAATSFRTQAEADVRQVNSLATRLESLAAAIRRGAREARDELARQEREARETAGAGTPTPRPR